jgi:hypothetical protein
MSELKYEIRVDAGQADLELRRVHTSATTLAGAEREVDRAVSQSNAALRQQGPAAKQAATGMQALQQQAKKASAVLGKQAAAIAILSQNIGEANGSVGKLVQGAGQMAAAFGAGGPWAAALVGGLALVGQLTKHLDETTAARDRAFDEKWRQVDEQSKRVNALREEVRLLNKELDDPNKRFLDMQERAMALQAEAYRLENAALSDADGQRDNMRARARFMLAEAKALEAVVDKRLEINRIRADEADEAKAAEQAEERRAKALERAKDARAEELQMAREFAQWWNYDSLDEDDQRIAQENKARQEEKARITEENQRMEDEAAKRRQLIYLNALKDEEDAKKESKRRIEAENKRHLEEIAAQNKEYAMQATAIVAGASQQLISDLISGQEQALERFGLSIMAQAGQALVSYGTQAIGRGVLELSSPFTAALAPASFAAGAGLVAAGVGLGGVSAGLGNLMGGGQRERRLPGSMAAPQQTGNGGGTVIQITYAGASGPTADQGGRAVVEGLARAQRRQEAAGPVSR